MGTSFSTPSTCTFCGDTPLAEAASIISILTFAYAVLAGAFFYVSPPLPPGRPPRLIRRIGYGDLQSGFEPDLVQEAQQRFREAEKLRDELINAVRRIKLPLDQPPHAEGLRAAATTTVGPMDPADTALELVDQALEILETEQTSTQYHWRTFKHYVDPPSRSPSKLHAEAGAAPSNLPSHPLHRLRFAYRLLLPALARPYVLWETRSKYLRIRETFAELLSDQEKVRLKVRQTEQRAYFKVQEQPVQRLNGLERACADITSQLSRLQ